MKMLERGFKWLFIFSLLLTLLTYFLKDRLPNPNFYNTNVLTPPIQEQTEKPPFFIRANKQTYQIFPRFEYELNGVVVSITRAGELGDIWHFKRWKDFINVRDICVLWGKNISSGLYQKLTFNSDTWTCWLSLPDRESAEAFEFEGLSNNHLLTNDYFIKKKLMNAELGDQIYLKGVLAEYKNKGNGFYRGTSVTRTDSGNGACETIYLDEFKIIKKANWGLRVMFNISFWTMILSGILFLIFFCIAPLNKENS